MTRTANGGALSAPAPRGVTWYTLPLDEDGPVPRGAPACADGDEILCRVDGEATPCTVERRHGTRFVRDEDGADVSHRADAIAHPLPRSRSGKTLTKAERRAAGWTRLDILLNPRSEKRLTDLCEHEGLSRADMIRTMIDGTWSEMRDAGEIE